MVYLRSESPGLETRDQKPEIRLRKFELQTEVLDKILRILSSIIIEDNLVIKIV